MSMHCCGNRFHTPPRVVVASQMLPEFEREGIMGKTRREGWLVASAVLLASCGSEDDGATTAVGGSLAMGGSAGAELGAGGAGGVGMAGSGMAGADVGTGAVTPAGNQVFLLFGQSNMEGVPPPSAEDREAHPRVRVLAYDGSCDGRTYNEWAPAIAPLHRCWAGVGPGDTFGKAMAEAWPEATIDLVPASISGVDIDFFVKGVVSARRAEFQIPPDDTREGAYEMLLERARLAQEQGPIRGILFHQGESDTGNPAWVGKVAGIVADLRADLGLGEDVPFIAGELPYAGCCASHNPLVRQLPDSIPNAHVVSAEGLDMIDQFHFDLEGMHELGRRYANAMLDALQGS